MPTTSSTTTKTIIMATDKCVIWLSNKIPYAYFYKNYWKQAGHIGNSCMRHKKNQRCLNFYIKNNVKIVVILSPEGKVKARALLWENIKIQNLKKTVTYLDRCYYSEESQRAVYSEFAKDNKFLYYGKGSNDRERAYYVDNINIEGITHLPYTDTFKYLYYKHGILASPAYRASSVQYKSKLTLSHQGDGGYMWKLDPNCIVEAISGHKISKKDAIYIKKYAGHILKENIVSIDGDYYYRFDNKITICFDGTACLRKNAVSEYHTNNLCNKKDMIKIDRYDGYVNKHSLITINNIQYATWDDDIISFNTEYYLKKDCYYSKCNNIYVPKLKAIIVSNIILRDSNPIEWEYNKKSEFSMYSIVQIPVVTDVDYDSVDNIGNYIKLNTGEFIINTKDNTKYIMRRNGKYVLKHLYKSRTKTEKNQLKFAWS